MAVGHVETSIDEIESKIAHGFYAEAEQSLKDIIQATPASHRAKLRLAEVYYLNERKDEFAEIAADIYAHHRVDMEDADWQRVMHMGKIIAPDRPPFSGPIPVERNA